MIWLRSGNGPTAAVEKMLRRDFQSILQFAADASAACLEIYEARDTG